MNLGPARAVDCFYNGQAVLGGTNLKTGWLKALIILVIVAVEDCISFYDSLLQSCASKQRTVVTEVLLTSN